MNISFLGGPLNGQQHEVPAPLPAQVYAAELHTDSAGYINPAADFPPQEAGKVSTYVLRKQRAGDGHNATRHVYVADDYNPSPSLPIISRRFAAVCEQHGMREGVHFRAYPAAP
ncbi:hypothetical protein [Micromonospora profundi]|uniref:hypothetical protein n=1 Tax=Micromonospora profundi TaxID=1420889 RepID=UPI0036563FFE